MGVSRENKYMNECFFEIKGASVNPEALMEEIEKHIKEKEKNGVYSCHSIPKKADIEFLDISNDTQFMEYYLRVIRRTWAVDINDFEIPKKKGFTGFLELKLKKLIWKLLKFYTYRIFSDNIFTGREIFFKNIKGVIMKKSASIFYACIFYYSMIV